MSKYFNRLLLSDRIIDAHPRSWICIQGKGIKEKVREIEKEIVIEKGINRETISKGISQKLKCNRNTIKNLLRGSTEFYPVPFLEELYNQTINSGRLEELNEIVEKLKVNSASAKPIRIPKELSANLARIVGAFCADGSLSLQFVISSKNKEELERNILFNNRKIMYSSVRKEFYIPVTIDKMYHELIKRVHKENSQFRTQTHYNIELTDEHKSSVEAFNRWILEEFDIKPTFFQKRSNKNAYRTIFSNKIFARLLIKFFDFLPGYKTDIVKEPRIIRESPLKIRKNFAMGSIMFDGSISKNKTLTFSSISKDFAESIDEILTLDNIKTGIFQNKRGEYVVYTILSNKIEKLLEYFEKGTKKWDLLMWLSNKDFTSNQVSYENDIRNKDILKILKQVKSCDYLFLQKTLNLSSTSIRQHLLLLKSRGVIELSNKPKNLNEYTSESATVFLKEELHNYIFDKILERFNDYTKYSDFIEINHATLSSWKVRKNRIPLRVLRQICISLDVPYKEALNNVIETDREIAEII